MHNIKQAHLKLLEVKIIWHHVLNSAPLIQNIEQVNNPLNVFHSLTQLWRQTVNSYYKELGEWLLRGGVVIKGREKGY